MTVEGDSGGDPKDLDGNGGQRRSDAGDLSHDGDRLLRVAGEGHVVASDGDPLRGGDWLLRVAGEGHVAASDNNDTGNSGAAGQSLRIAGAGHVVATDNTVIGNSGIAGRSSKEAFVLNSA